MQEQQGQACTINQSVIIIFSNRLCSQVHLRAGLYVQFVVSLYIALCLRILKISSFSRINASHRPELPKVRFVGRLRPT